MNTEMKSNYKRCEPAKCKQAVKKLTKRHTLYLTSLHCASLPKGCMTSNKELGLRHTDKDTLKK